MKRLLIILFLFFPAASFARLQGQPLIDSLLNRLPQAKEDTNKALLLDKLSAGYWALDWANGILYGNQALSLSDKLEWTRGKGLAYFDLAVNYRYKAEYATALAYCDSAIQICTALNEKRRFGRISSMKSILYIDQSEYPKALDEGFNALKVFEEIHDTIDIAKALTNIGIIYEDQADHAKAMEFQVRALKFYEQLHDKTGIAIGLSNIGLVYSEEKDYANALETQFRALKICEELGNKNLLSKVLGYIGDAYNGSEEYSKAIEYLFKAEKINEELNDKAGLAEKLQNIGRTYLAMARDSISHKKEDKVISGSKQHNLALAIEYFTRAATIHKEIGNIKDLSENYGGLAIANELAGNYKDALAAHIQYMANKDSFNSIVKTKQLNELETKYETKEKDRQILGQEKQIASDRKINLSLALSSVLFLSLGLIIFTNQRKTNKLNTLITFQKKEVEKLNSVKDRIFSVISHDLRTPVNSLISFTQLLENGDIPPEKLQKYADTLKSNLGYTAGLMENLLNWARTQMQGYKPVFEQFDMADIIRQTIGLLIPEAGKKGLRIVNNIQKDTIVLADMNMTLLLIRNLLSNAIKYTPAGGVLTLSAFSASGTVQVKIQDTGVGIAGELVDEFNTTLTGQPITSTPGTNKEKGTGLGLMLCKGFAGIMHGSITLESEPGKGSCFTVRLPMA